MAIADGPPELSSARRVLWMVVLVLAALGGAGLATAADRSPTDDARPELTWSAERAAHPWTAAMSAWLENIDEQVAELSGAGREVLIGAASQNFDRISAAVAEGDTIVTDLAGAIDGLRAQRYRQQAVIDDLRLGDASRRRLAAVDQAIGRTSELSQVWAELVDAGTAGDTVAVTERLVEIESARGAINEALGLLP